jgi:hypothetical protein
MTLQERYEQLVDESPSQPASGHDAKNLPVRPHVRDVPGKPRTASDKPYEHGAR